VYFVGAAQSDDALNGHEHEKVIEDDLYRYGFEIGRHGGLVQDARAAVTERS
jgi:hypothetical protein